MDPSTDDSSFPISYGWCSDLSLLSVAALDFRIRRIRLCVSDRGGRIDDIDHMVLPIFPRRRSQDVDDRRGPGWHLHVSLHHFTATRLRLAHGRGRALRRARSRDVRNAQGRLVRARRELEFNRQLRSDELFALLDLYVFVGKAVLQFTL